ncbi:MAG: DUF1549 domain-containing protein, partial [Kordiimonadaceae bacterium]|nr:DUF1549 domain-containing protein [Kordiimonadaceae bacterium]
MTVTSTIKKPVLIYGAIIGLAAMSIPLFFIQSDEAAAPEASEMTAEAAHAGLEIASGRSAGPTSVPDVVTFNKDVRPILSDNCFVCHGNDKGSRKAELNLSTFDGAVLERKGGLIALIPGDAENSEIYKRLTHINREDRMPPQSTGNTVSDIEIAIVEKWINDGAEYEKHWSYNAPVKAAVPDIGADWTVNTIDQFIAEKHQENGLTPADEADKRTLIRRVTLDLTGLPPTPGEVADFVADQSDDAYENLVDRLMGSVHFGERMAMNWLDVVRYADTWGYHSDNERTVWPYRDYVIEAF